MVQIAPNQAEISGELLSIAPDSERPGFFVFNVHISSAHPVEGFANFFERDVGQTVPIIVRPESAAASAKPGPITLKVRKGQFNRSFAD
jgi:hypothetical protein